MEILKESNKVGKKNYEAEIYKTKEEGRTQEWRKIVEQKKRGKAARKINNDIFCVREGKYCR